MTLPAGLTFVLDKLHSPNVADRESAYAECTELLAMLGQTTQVALGENLAINLVNTPTSYARSYQARVLREIAAHGVWEDEWTNPTLAWWVQEIDHDVHDENLGDVDAIGTGAQLIATLAQHTTVNTRFLLAAVRKRMITPTPVRWPAPTAAHLAVAACAILHRPGVSAQHATEWLQGLPLAPSATGTTCGETWNTITTLQQVFFLLSTTHATVVHAASICDRISEAITTAVPELTGKVTAVEPEATNQVPS